MTRGHAVAYRDALEDLTWMKPKNATEHLESLHVIFAVAMSEGLLDQNPFSGVKVRPSWVPSPLDARASLKST